jgi:hypothetical protein
MDRLPGPISIPCNPLREEMIFLHKRSWALILGDLIQIGGPYKGPFRNALIRIGGVADQGGVG